jgi:hypothetical protein
MIEKSFQPSVKLFFRATREIINGTLPVKIMIIMALALPIAAISITVLTNIKLSATVWGGASGLFIYTFMALPLFQFISIKRNLASNPSANQTQKYELSEHGVRNFGNGVDVNLDWQKIIKIKSSKSFLLFYISNSAAYFIPKELVTTAELEQISQWHTEKRG